MNYTIKSGKNISNLKLQKILYYLQARFLTNDSGPLFNDEISKWRYGPVVPSVYHEFKLFGSGAITRVLEPLIIHHNDEGGFKVSKKKFSENKINPLDKKVILETVDILSKYKAFDLVERTHKQKIWKKHENKIELGQAVPPYKNDEIIHQFNSHPEEKLWNN
ncbi:Panacea domain-containing protein [Terrilactibacillus tamarindi]|uniref:Panacea domain-containing protein n=1 Tax=Terrilactibacillus tamarindi TaxID=2599694 RepID=UPI0018AD2B8F|nr:type II toxin-antitoxin system antitoxin SocA domain-containing protein [Terrilactibacillus tamarindi]